MNKAEAIGTLILSLVFLSGKPVIKDPALIIGPETRLIIHGQTNVNSFQCKMDFYTKLDTLAYTTDNDGCMLFFKENKMNIPVHTFDCENKLINKDFYQVLKSDRYPFVQIQFVALERWAGAPNIGGTAYITLAGVTRPFTIHYQVNSTTKQLLLKGHQKICFSDFGLEAPQKMMGLIKVQDNLEVEFHLALRAI
jgi:YceI-like domain